MCKIRQLAMVPKFWAKNSLNLRSEQLSSLDWVGLGTWGVYMGDPVYMDFFYLSNGSARWELCRMAA